VSDIDAKALELKALTKWFGPRCPRCSGVEGEEDGLEKNYCPACGTVYALRDVGFSLYEGEVLGVVGESGSGKSTILNCLYYDMEPSAGSAYLSSYESGNVDVFSVSAQAKRGIRNTLLGKVYQNPLQGLRMRFSAVSNVAEKLIAAGGRNVAAMEARAMPVAVGSVASASISSDGRSPRSTARLNPAGMLSTNRTLPRARAARPASSSGSVPTMWK